MRNKSALITGGAGFIGSHLTDTLLKDGWHVLVVDNLSTGSLKNLERHRDNPNLKIMVGDLKDSKIAMEALTNVETVFHFAANPEVRLSTTHPKIHFDENIMATFNLLEAIRQAGNVKYLIFASSSSVYGEPEAIPVKESSSINPVSIYGASKVACEAFIVSYSRLYGLKSVALRYANVIGSRLNHGVIYDFITKLMRNEGKLQILGDGSQMRSFLHVDDAIEATVKVYGNLNDSFEAYNVGNEDWLTVNDVANIIVEVLGLSNIKYVFESYLGGIGWLGDVKKIALSVSKMRSVGWRPRYDSKTAVELAARAICQENLAWVKRT